MCTDLHILHTSPNWNNHKESWLNVILVRLQYNYSKTFIYYSRIQRGKNIINTSASEVELSMYSSFHHKRVDLQTYTHSYPTKLKPNREFASPSSVISITIVHLCLVTQNIITITIWSTAAVTTEYRFQHWDCFLIQFRSGGGVGFQTSVQNWMKTDKDRNVNVFVSCICCCDYRGPDSS